MKKLKNLAAGLICAATLISSTAICASAAETLSGDVNEDGEVDAIDLALMVTYINGMPVTGTFNFENADMNDDGYVNSIDSEILRYILLHG